MARHYLAPNNLRLAYLPAALSLVGGSSGRRRNSVHRTDTVNGQIISCTPQQHFNTIHRPDASSITIAYYNKAHRTDTSSSTTTTAFYNIAHQPETNISSTTAFYNTAHQPEISISSITAFYNSSQRLDTRSITTIASYNIEADQILAAAAAAPPPPPQYSTTQIRHQQLCHHSILQHST